MPEFIDTHSHLDFPDYAQDLPQVLERAQAAGVTRMITIGTDLASSERAVQLAERYDNLYAAVGWHPSHALEAPEDLRPTLLQLAGHPKVVAIGETGMDYHRLPSQQPGADSAADVIYKEKQAILFSQQLEVAAEYGLNCIVHQREAFEDTVRLMAPFQGRVRGVFHCFASDLLTLERILALGSLVSFTGILTFKNGQNIRDALKAAPMGQFMLETDCPFLAPIPYRGKRCEPAYIKEIAAVASQVKGCTLDELAESTNAAAAEFFMKLIPSRQASAVTGIP